MLALSRETSSRTESFSTAKREVASYLYLNSPPLWVFFLPSGDASTKSATDRLLPREIDSKLASSPNNFPISTHLACFLLPFPLTFPSRHYDRLLEQHKNLELLHDHVDWDQWLREVKCHPMYRSKQIAPIQLGCIIKGSDWCNIANLLVCLKNITHHHSSSVFGDIGHCGSAFIRKPEWLMFWWDRDSCAQSTDPVLGFSI